MSANKYHTSWAMAGICLMGFIAFLDYTIVATALPTIQKEMGMSVANLQWLMNVYSLALCTLMPLMGRLGDIFGPPKVLLVAVLVFVVASIGAAMAPFTWVLLIFRVVQGIGAAALFPVAAATVTLLYPKARQAKSLGIYSAVTGIGMALGPFTGGALISALGSWRWVFWVNVPVVAIAVVLCWISGVLSMPSHSKNSSIDWVGAWILVVALTALSLVGIEGPAWGWLSGNTIFFAVLSVVCLLYWVKYEQRQQDPLVDLELFKNKQFFSAAILGAMIGGGTSAFIFIEPLYLQHILLYPAFQVGLILCFISVCFVVGAPLAGAMMQRYHFKIPAIFTMSLLIISAVVQLFLPINRDIWLLILAFIPLGVCWGMSNVVAVGSAINAAGTHRGGAAVGAIGTLWNLGAVLTVSLTVTLFRVEEFAALEQGLSILGLQLDTGALAHVRHLLGQPQAIEQYLQRVAGAGHHAANVVHIYKLAFMSGFKALAWSIGAITAVGLAFLIYWMPMQSTDET